MVRKQTWILLIVFAILLGAAFYLQKNPLPKAESATPSPTAQAQMVPGLAANQITWVEVKDSQGSTTQIQQDALGNWFLGPEGKEKIETGLAEQIREGIAAAQVQTSLPTGLDLQAVSLTNPAHTLTVAGRDGKKTVIRIGSATPTGGGYYVQVDNQAPVVVSTGAIDGIIELMKKESLTPPTPTPATTGTPEAAPTK